MHKLSLPPAGPGTPTKTWEQLLDALRPLMEINNLKVGMSDIILSLEHFTLQTISLPEVIGYIADHPGYPATMIDLNPPWDEYLRLQIVLADVLGNCVWSTGNLTTILSAYDVDEKTAEAYIAKLLKVGVIYKNGDVASYLANVRNKGKVAYDEAQMMLSRSAGNATRYVDVEFPYDSTGRYVVDHLPEGWTYTTTDGMNIYSPP